MRVAKLSVKLPTLARLFTRLFVQIDFWPQVGLCCVIKAGALLAARTGDPMPEGLESLYAEQWLHKARQPLVRGAFAG